MSLSWNRCRRAWASAWTAWGVVGRVGRTLPGQAAFDDPAGGPGVHRVRRHLDLEHAVGQVLPHSPLGDTAAAGRALERLELASAFVDGHDAALRIELCLYYGVLVLASDLAHPPARVVTHDHHLELGGVLAGLGQYREPRAARSHGRAGRGGRSIGRERLVSAPGLIVP
jgi:hypothetical protein